MAMTENDDRLDEIDADPGGVSLMDVAWLVRELRDTRAEIEAANDHIKDYREHLQDTRAENEQLRNAVVSVRQLERREHAELNAERAENHRLRAMWDKSGKNDLIAERDQLRAEVERWHAAQAAHADVYERLTAELADKRAKVERVEALCEEATADWCQITSNTALPEDEPLLLSVGEVRAALTGGEQG